MKPDNAPLQKIIELAKQLSPLEKVLLIEKVVPDLEAHLRPETKMNNSMQSAYGSLSDLGTAPSEKEMDEMRQEVFSNFPREDI